MRKLLPLLALTTILSGCTAMAENWEEGVMDTGKTFGVIKEESAAATTPAKPKPQIGSYGFDETGMDAAAKPGDDFYKYANGAWAKRTEIPADRSNFGMFTQLDELSKERTREILEAGKADPQSKVGRAYASFLDENAVNAKGIAPIKPWLDEIRALKAKAGYAALAAKADRMAIGTPFGSYVGQDDKNPETYIYQMVQGGIGMPDRDYYLEKGERFEKARAAYVKHLENVLTLAGETNSAARAKALMAFETKIATVHWNKEDSSDASKTYHKTSIAALQAEAPGFDFKTFIRGLGVTTDELLYAQPSAFKGIAKLVGDAPLDVLKDALLIKSLDGYSDQLSDDIAKESFSFYSTALNGTPEMQPRWKRAVEYTVDSMGEAVGQAYAAKYFTPETKAAANVLVKNVLAAMGRRIDNLTWMSAATKQRAHAKLAGFTVKIGYPDRWRDYSALEVKSDDLFGNAVRTNLFNHEYAIGKLGKPIYRWEWGMTPMEVNAYANFGMKEIVFPAAILQPPFFDLNADDAINYGGIGAVIGHEISHHFDDQGAKYDENGRLSDWWTAEDTKAFEAATKRLVAQYDAYEVLPGVKINGEFTLGENIGDLAGITVAYDAYHAALAGKEAPILNGTTGDQRFFLGWGQVWRRNYREANLAQRVTTDPHSPSTQRAWVVRNIDGWYDAFKPAEGEALYLKPEDRVRIW